jgi:hypothetical protein
MRDKDFIVYLDDDERKISGFVDIVELKDNYVKFLTNANNTIIIPMNRILKIKRRNDG